MLVSANAGGSDEPAYPFTQRELARLTVYRAAVQIGFYNEAGPERRAWQGDRQRAEEAVSRPR
jgi:hypothetical protein